MKISNQELEDAVIKIAVEKYGNKVFRRRPLMNAVEASVKAAGNWTATDDAKSGSAGEKSVGLAKIDWAISYLYEHGKLAKTGRDQWRVPPASKR